MPTPLRFRLSLAALAAASLMAMSPLTASAGQDPQAPPPSRGTLVVERVNNGPLFGAEFKFTEINGKEAYLFGGYAGVIFDSKLFVGGAGYWKVDDGCYMYGGHYYGVSYCDYDDYDDYHGANGYGGLVLEWYALRSPVVSVSARGLIGGGVASLAWEDYYVTDPGNRPQPHHGNGYPPPSGGYYYGMVDQGYFVFEPQVNVSVSVAPGFAVVGGAGYRVVAWANGWEDQLQGFTATVAVRFGRR
jgi:hypothetical protein